MKTSPPLLDSKVSSPPIKIRKLPSHPRFLSTASGETDEEDARSPSTIFGTRERANRDLFILCFSLGKGFLFLMYKRTFPGQGAGELEGQERER